MCTVCVLYVYCMCTACVLYVYCMCTVCVLYVYCTCTVCVLYVYCMFTILDLHLQGPTIVNQLQQGLLLIWLHFWTFFGVFDLNLFLSFGRGFGGQSTFNVIYFIWGLLIPKALYTNTYMYQCIPTRIYFVSNVILNLIYVLKSRRCNYFL